MPEVGGVAPTEHAHCSPVLCAPVGKGHPMDVESMSDDELWQASSTEISNNRAEALFELGERAERVRRYSDADGLYAQAAEVWGAVGASIDATKAIMARGRMADFEKRYDDALRFADEAIVGFTEALSLNWLAYAYYHRAQAHAGLGAQELALADFDNAVCKYLEVDNFNAAVSAELDLVDYLGGADRQAEAVEEARNAIGYSALASDQTLTHRAYDRCAAAFNDIGEYEQCLDMHTKALRYAEHIEDIGLVRRSRVKVAEALLDVRRLPEALEHANVAIELFVAANDRPGAIDSELIKLRCLYELGNYDEGDALRERLDVFIPSTNRSRAHGSLEVDYGRSLISRGRLLEADAAFTRAWKIVTEAEDPWAQAVFAIEWAEVLNDQGEYQRAYDLLEPYRADLWGQGRIYRSAHLTTLAVAKAHLVEDMTDRKSVV